MLDRAKEGKFAYPAINISSSQTINATLAGFAEAESDGIIQVSWGGANYASGPTINNLVDGTIALAEYAHGREELPGQHRPSHRPLPAAASRRLAAPTAGHRR